MDFERRTYRLPALREDELVADLWRRGALGCEVLDDDRPGRTRLVVYFAAGGAPTLEERWRRLGVEDAGGETIADRDWLAEYRLHSQPLDVGRRFLVDPRDIDDRGDEPPSEHGRTILRIPAQNAFGTGSHESTRLAVELLEAHADRLAGTTVLDVGTGSGILAFVALHLGARRVIGHDLDAPSVITARVNAWRNGVGGAVSFFAGTADALGAGARFDLALINVLPERVIDDYPSLVERLAHRGLIISSGNLLEHRDAWLARLAGLGLVPVAERSDGEWVAFLLRRS